jgi:hypothetical protein
VDDPENFGTQGKISHVKKAAIEKGEKSTVTRTPIINSADEASNKYQHIAVARRIASICIFTS